MLLLLSDVFLELLPLLAQLLAHSLFEFQYFLGLIHFGLNVCELLLEHLLVELLLVDHRHTIFVTIKEESNIVQKYLKPVCFSDIISIVFCKHIY